MEPVNHIQNRIRKRQQSTSFIEPISEKKENSEKVTSWHHFFYSITMKFMIVVALLVGFLIYAKQDKNATFIKEKFGYQLDFTYINQLGDGFVSKLLDFNIFASILHPSDDSLVNALPTYVGIGNNQYTNEDGKVHSIGSGKVAFVGDGIAGQHIVIVKTVEEIVISYFGVEETFVFAEDWVDNDDLIASFNEKVTIYFSKKGETLSYEEVVLLIE